MSIVEERHEISHKPFSMRRLIKKIDVFGHQVNLNFDDVSPVHKTIVGGIFSIFLRIIILTILTVKINRILTYGNPDLTSYIEANVKILEEN